jgi:hypothetical protein
VRCSRRVIHGALLLVLLPALASCSRDTPLCGYADGLVAASELTGAADAYAAAQEADEGDCAEDGLARVGELRASAGAYVAKGRVAARAGKTAAATASFKAALAVDRSDDAAAAELQRLTRAAPTPAATVSTVVVAGPAAPRSGTFLPWTALAVAVLAVLASALIWRRCRRDTEQAVSIAQADSIGQQTATERIDAARSELAKLGKRLDGVTKDLADAQRRAADAGQAAEAFRDDLASFVSTSIRALQYDGAPRVEEQYLPRSREK